MNQDLKKCLIKKWAVVGFDYYRAIDIMSGIEKTCDKIVSKKFHSKYELRTEFTDGTKLIWVEASKSFIGFRSGKMWCDERIDKKFFNTVIMPCYTGEYEDIIFL